MIPKESYLQEGKEIRNFGLMVGAMGSLRGADHRQRLEQKIYPTHSESDGPDGKRGKRAVGSAFSGEKKGWPELDRLNVQFYQTVQKLKGYIAKLQDTEQEKAREELLALQYQMILTSFTTL